MRWLALSVITVVNVSAAVCSVYALRKMNSMSTKLNRFADEFNQMTRRILESE